MTNEHSGLWCICGEKGIEEVEAGSGGFPDETTGVFIDGMERSDWIQKGCDALVLKILMKKKGFKKKWL